MLPAMTQNLVSINRANQHLLTYAHLFVNIAEREGWDLPLNHLCLIYAITRNTQRQLTESSYNIYHMILAAEYRKETQNVAQNDSIDNVIKQMEIEDLPYNKAELPQLAMRIVNV